MTRWLAATSPAAGGRRRRIATLVMVMAVATATLPGFAIRATAQERFDDVPPEAEYAEAVRWMAETGIAEGTAPGVFSPDRPVSRGEAAVFLWRMEGEPTAILHRFVDIEEPWQQLPVSWMAGEGLTTGATSSTFRPDDPVTRGEMAVFLHRLAGEPPAPAHPFDDVGDPALDAAVSWITGTGISAGMGPDSFGPGQPVTRSQIAELLFRYSGEPKPSRSAQPPPPSVTAPTTTVPHEERPATMVIDDSNPRVGDLVTISGDGVDPEQNVTLSLGDRVVAEVVPLADGSYSAAVEIPELTPGSVVLSLSQAGDVEVEMPVSIAQTPSSRLAAFYVAAVSLMLAAAVAVFWRRRTLAPAEPIVESASATPPAVDESASKLKRSVEALERRLASEEPRWIRHRPELGEAASIERIGVWNAGSSLWAVGRADAEASPHAMVWNSPDGATWGLAADLGPGYFEVAAVAAGGLVGLGSRLSSTDPDVAGGSALWRSPDLSSWTRQDLVGRPFEQSRFDGVVEFDGRLYAHGRNAAGACLWIYGDHWITRQTAGPVDLVLRTDRGLFVFGRDTHDQRHVVLFTDDGDTWRTLPDVAVFEKGRVVAGCEFEGGIVVLGSDHVNESAAVWVSDDGIAWLRAPADFAPRTAMEHVVPTPTGLLAVGSARAGGSTRRQGLAVFWESVDAITWTPLEGNARLKDAFITSAAWINNRLVCAGRHLDPGDETGQGSAAVWALDLGMRSVSPPEMLVSTAQADDPRSD